MQSNVREFSSLMTALEQCQMATRSKNRAGIRASLAVRHPNVLHLSRVFEEPAAFRLFRVEPIDDAAFIGPDLLQIAHGVPFGCRCAGFVGKRPYGIQVIVL